METGLIQGDVCNRNGCKGVMQQVHNDTGCSCHICPPCSHCVDMLFECDDCEFNTQDLDEGWSPLVKSTSTPPVYKRKSDHERFAELADGEFGYITIPGKYYWMEYKGKYPEEMSTKKILENFNTCFGCKWIKHPMNGEFHLKVYTD